MADSPALDIPCPESDSALTDRLYALLDDFDPVAIEELDGVIRVFFQKKDRRDAAQRAIAECEGVRASPSDISDENWARRSQEDLHAIEAGGLIVAPPWDVPKGPAPVIIIEPSTGFGTGHHATTRLCLRLMQQLDLRGARVLDVGTGSGVLALAAWKLGASDIVAIDSDSDALENARDNIARNGAAAAIDVILDDLSTLRIQRADVVLANLTGASLVRHADELRGLAVDGGYLILSGFTPDDLAVICAAFGSSRVIAEQAEDAWAALTLLQIAP